MQDCIRIFVDRWVAVASFALAACSSTSGGPSSDFDGGAASSSGGVRGGATEAGTAGKTSTGGTSSTGSPAEGGPEPVEASAGSAGAGGMQGLVDSGDANVLADACVLAGTEDCFDNVDDDCDGLVDCADPDCTGGSSAKAACVADPGAFAPGVIISGGASAICPTVWPNPTTISSGINQACGRGTCSCASPKNSCTAHIYDDGSSGSCPQSNSVASADLVTTCTSSFAIPAGDYHSIATQWTGDCGNPTGAPAKPSPTWDDTEKFCTGGLAGGGCGAGWICVPPGPNHCAMKAGSQLGCPVNYVKRTTRYYTGFDDQSRSCQCSCSLTAPGSCMGTPTLAVWTGPGCTGASNILSNGCSNNDLSAFQTASLSGISVKDGPSCAIGATQIGTTTLTGEQTVCCLP